MKMIKQVVVFLLAFFVLSQTFSSFSKVGAERFSLSELGISPYLASAQPKNMVLDGVLTSDEYPVFNRSDFGNGLDLLPFGFSNEENQPFPEKAKEKFSEVRQTVGISAAGEFLNVGILLSDLSENAIRTVHHSVFGDCYQVVISFGVSFGVGEADWCFLQNCYYFSKEDLHCIGSEGTRLIRENGEFSLIARFSSVSPNQDKGCFQENGTVWDGKTFCDHSVLKKDQDTFCLEARIPLGDLVRLEDVATQEALKAGILKGDGTVFGCALFQIVSSNAAIQGESGYWCLTNGMDPSVTVCQNGDSLREWLKKEKSIVFPSFLSEMIPTPLTFSDVLLNDQTLPNENDSDTNPENEQTFPFDQTEEQKKDEIPLKTDPEEDLFSGLPKEEWEDAFSGVPDPEENIPDEVEKVPIDSEEDEDEKESLLGSGLTFGAGVFLFCSVVAVAVVMLRQEKANQENERKTKKENPKKKSK